MEKVGIVKNLTLSLAAVVCMVVSGTVHSAGQSGMTRADGSFTISGTVATGVAGSGAPVTVTGADGTPLSQTATAGADGTYSINFSSAPAFPIQITTSVNGETLTNLATNPSSATRNLNQVTSAATTAAIASARSLSNVTESGLNTAGQSLLDTALGGGVTYATFGTSTFTARTSATDFTQTASVADVFLDTLGELAATNGTPVTTLLTTQTTPLLEDDSFLVSAAENLALVDTTETVSSVITGGTKAQAADSIATSIRNVVSTVGTKDKAAISAARAVGAAIKSSISSTNTLRTSSDLSNLANNVTLLVQSSVVNLVQSQSASNLSEADLTVLATTLGTSQGRALQTTNLVGSQFTETQVSSELSTLTTELANISTVVQGTANKVAAGTSVAQAVSEDSSAITAVVTSATTATTPTTVAQPTTRGSRPTASSASAGGGGSANVDVGSPSGAASPN